ncbi:MAG: hypothetical protein EAZ53_08285 [Bacteroidetes bacterium]|nr:MAG: hypothetical protein EAZ53_08285 [Bacteroidota bacterium]
MFVGQEDQQRRKIVPTLNFGRELKRLAKKHRSIKADIDKLGKQLEVNPTMGDAEIEQICGLFLFIM